MPASPLVRGLGWYLSACLMVAGLVGGSPWLHRVLEHGASDGTSPHVHGRGGRSLARDDFFAAFQSTALAVTHGHAHSHAPDHVHPDARQGTSDTAAGHERGTIPDSSGHSHHGLPGLLAAGLVDLAGPAATALGAVLACVLLRSLPVVCWTEVLALDRNQAARPPPRWMGDW
ncbi:MAG: hypothetical protein J0L84_16505 [Verrucomicrobia bacterium]|nr:hypothetical protein [Verrucomicrobiota bacterium]